MVSPRKPVSSENSSARLATKIMASSAKSCESLYSASSRESACLIYQTKQQSHRGCSQKHSANGIMHHGKPKQTPQQVSEIHQRVMSARNLRAKSFQNQLADAQTEIANLAHENRMLRTLHKRQSSALSKYESTNAELPQLLHSHAEELRVWQTKYRNLQTSHKELEQKLKQKEAIILSLSDQNKHYSQLNKDKNLDERQRLQEKVRNLEQRLQERDNDISLMARKVQLETKNCRQQLLNEQKKCKEIMLKLEKSKLELSGYRKLEEFTMPGDKPNPMTLNRRLKQNKIDDTDKLEKSLESIEKGIEKNKHSDFDTLTETFGAGSPFDFETDDNNEKSRTPSPQVKKKANLNIEHKAKPSNLAKLTLPPANGVSKQVQPPKMRATLKQLLSNSKPGVSSKLPISTEAARNSGVTRSRSKNTGNGNVKESTAGKRQDFESSDSSSPDSTKDKTMAFLSAKLDDDSDHDYALGGDNNYGLVDNFVSDEIYEDGVNPNDASLINYETYKEKSIDVDDSYGEDEDELDSNDSMENTPNMLRMKDEVSSIRKQISDDYKERDSFLNTFCRQTSGSNMREDAALKKRNSIATGSSSHMAGSRKQHLLAALKAIDDSPRQD